MATCRTPPGEGGGNKPASRGVSPTLATGAQRKWKGRSASGGSHKRTASVKIGEWLAGREGRPPLAAFAVACFVLWGRRCGQDTGSAGMGSGRHARLAGSEEGTPSPRGRSLRAQRGKMEHAYALWFAYYNCYCKDSAMLKRLAILAVLLAVVCLGSQPRADGQSGQSWESG